MRKLFLILAMAWPVTAQTTVTATFTAPTGDLVSGSCSIQAIGPFSSGSYRVIGAPVIVTFTTGAFTASLTPTDAATPAGQYYRTTCSVPLQTVNGRSVGPFKWGPKIWIVPTSATSVDIGTVEVQAAPAQTANILPLQLAAGGSDGQVLTKDSTAARGMTWATGGGGGTWGSITGTLASQADLAAALTAKQSVSAKDQPGGYVGLDADGKATVGTIALDPVNGITTPEITVGDGTQPGEWPMNETLANGADYISWLVPALIPQTYRLQLPSAAPNGQALTFTAPDATSHIATGSWATLSGSEKYVLTFDGSTTTLADGSTITWASNSTQYTTSWTPPTGVRWVRVAGWSGGGGGEGGGNYGAAGGAGGGYSEKMCAVTPGTAVTIAIGKGGSGGAFSFATSGGVTTFGTCISINGGKGGTSNNAATGGAPTGYRDFSYVDARGGYGLCSGSTSAQYVVNCHPLNPWLGGLGTPSPTGASCAETAGSAGGFAMWGAGGGGGAGCNSATGGTGGTSVYGGAGGGGGGYTSGGGVVACAAGTAPGGGGGAGGLPVASNPGCAGARGELRIYY